MLLDLRRHLRGAKVTLIWDGLPSHRSRLMQRFLAQQRSWLVAERLPAYAPELNPVEGLWSNIKGSEFANRCETTVAGLEDAADDAVDRVANSQQLLFSFLDKAISLFDHFSVYYANPFKSGMSASWRRRF